MLTEKISRRITLLLLVVLAAACSQVPISGRQQLNLVSADTLLAASQQQYRQFLEANTVIRQSTASAQVSEVGQRMAAAVEKYLRDHGRGGEAQQYDWEFNLVESEEVNAWAMPGGKVAVYSGILPITRDDTGLAVVMGHEIAHVVGRHGNERMSQLLVAQMGGQALAAVLASKPQASQDLWMRVYGAGAQVGIMLPYSRLQESEADRLGLVFMAIAGYDPRAAVDFWQRMAAQKGAGPRAPEFLSTHPADQTRIRQIQNFLPEALTFYRP